MIPPRSLSQPHSQDQSRMVRAVSSISLSQPRYLDSSSMNHAVSIQCPGLMIRPLMVSINSPFSPTVSSRALNSGCIKKVFKSESESSILAVNTGLSIASRIREAVLIRIIVMECPRKERVSQYFGDNIPGVVMKRSTRLKSSRAFSAYTLSPEANAYSDMAMAAKHSEKTYLRLRRGRPSPVTSKYIRPSVSKQCRSIKSIQLFEADSHSEFLSI